MNNHHLDNARFQNASSGHFLNKIEKRFESEKKYEKLKKNDSDMDFHVNDDSGCHCVDI